MRRPSWLNLPNVFTLARLALLPFIASAILGDRPIAAVTLFALAAVTDSVDGWMARRWGAITQAGAYFDPVVDKTLLSGVYLALALRGSVPWWFVALIFGRDLLILLGSAYALACTTLRSFPPTVWGKLSTFLQIVTAVAWMVRNAFPGPFPDLFARSVIWASAAMTTWSGMHYTWRGARMYRAWRSQFTASASRSSG